MLDVDGNKISDARAIYQNKVTKVYLYYTSDYYFYEGWASSIHKNDLESTVIFIPSL